MTGYQGGRPDLWCTTGTKALHRLNIEKQVTEEISVAPTDFIACFELSAQVGPSFSSALLPLPQVTAATQVPPPQQPVRKEMSGS